MDTGVEHGRQQDGGSGQAAPDGMEPPGAQDEQPVAAQPAMLPADAQDEQPDPAPARLPPMPVYEDVPTTILDLRAAFAEVGPHDAPPLGVVTVDREHPVRAALAFMAVLGLIAVAAGGAVYGVAAAGKSIYAGLSGPGECSVDQVTAGAALEQWLLDAARQAGGETAEVTRTGCVTAGIASPPGGQAASTSASAGRPTNRVITALAARDCTFGQASPSGVRTCTVTVGGKLSVLELRPSKDKQTTTFTVAYR